MIAIVLSQIKLVRDVTYTGDRRFDVVGAILGLLGMGGVVLGILVWQEGLRLRRAADRARRAGAGSVRPLARATPPRGQGHGARPSLFRLPNFRLGDIRPDAAEHHSGWAQ